MSRRKINGILAVIVLGLAVAAGISIINKSRNTVSRTVNANGDSSEAPPANQPPEDIAKRLDALIQMSADNPQNADILNEIGNLYYDLGEYDKAVASYRKSLEIQPRNPYVETDLATCLHYLNRNDEALSILDNVLKYRPDFSQALYNKGIVLIHGRNDIEGGIAVWEKLLKQDLDPAQRAKIEEAIRQYKSSTR